jgi:hypothetical protein
MGIVIGFSFGFVATLQMALPVNEALMLLLLDFSLFLEIADKVDFSFLKITPESGSPRPEKCHSFSIISHPAPLPKSSNEIVYNLCF